MAPTGPILHFATATAVDTITTKSAASMQQTEQQRLRKQVVGAEKSKKGEGETATLTPKDLC